MQILTRYVFPTGSGNIVSGMVHGADLQCAQLPSPWHDVVAPPAPSFLAGKPPHHTSVADIHIHNCCMMNTQMWCLASPATLVQVWLWLSTTTPCYHSFFDRSGCGQEW